MIDHLRLLFRLLLSASAAEEDQQQERDEADDDDGGDEGYQPPQQGQPECRGRPQSPPASPGCGTRDNQGVGLA